jgi:hypothetical protein
MALNDTLQNHDREIQALVDSFAEQLGTMLALAQAGVQGKLTTRLTFTKGVVDATPANRSALRQISTLFDEELDSLGLQHLVDAFVEQFGGQYKYFRQVLDLTLGADRAKKLDLTLDKGDQQFLGMFQADAATSIQAAVAGAGQIAQQKALMGIGGLTSKSLATTLAEQVSKSGGVAKSEAATAISSFYRQLADLQFQKIEEDEGWEISYKYVGPPATDILIRPFCRHLMVETRAGTTWTRPEINAMDNDQLDNVFVTGGGYNCRHQWIFADMKERPE